MERLSKLYELEEVIGGGSYGIVFLAKEKKTKRKFAVKHIKKKKANLIHLLQEIQTFALIKKSPHPNVVNCLELFEDDENLLLVYEYLPYGDLLHYLTKRRSLTEFEAKKLTWGIAKGVQHLHTLGIVHRDIKLENICIGKDGEAKLVDFNLSCTWAPTRKLKTYCGSLCYSSPEMCLGQPYVGPEVDVWSLAVLVYVFLFFRFPFDDEEQNDGVVRRKEPERDVSLSEETDEEIGGEYSDDYDGDVEEKKKRMMGRRIVSGDYYFPETGKGKDVSSTAKMLISSMLVVDSAHRATLSSVLAHEWFRELRGKDAKEEREQVDVVKGKNKAGESEEGKVKKGLRLSLSANKLFGKVFGSNEAQRRKN